MFAIGVENRQAAGWMLLIGTAFALAVGWLRCRKAGVSAGRILLCSVLMPLCTAFFSHLGYWLCTLPSSW